MSAIDHRDNSHKAQKMNFRLKIKVTVNSSWFRLCEPKIKI